MTEKRVVFDFEIDFSNGGGVQGQGFRLDIVGDEIADEVLADYIVQDMRLLMVGEVRIRNKQIISEAHKRGGEPGKITKLVDLSHTISDGLVTYKGLPAPIICDYLSREDSRAHYTDGVEFQIGKIEMVANTGTYIDCPSHRYADGKDLAEVGLERFADLDALVVHVPFSETLPIDASHFQGLDISNKAVLVHTGWDAHWNTDAYFEENPHLTKDACEYLLERGVLLVGIDSVNIDSLADKTRPAHSILLGADILIVEHMTNLAALPDHNFTFSAVPPKVAGMGTFPVRAMGKIPS